MYHKLKLPSKYVGLIALLILLAFSAACTAEKSKEPIRITCDDFNENQHITDNAKVSVGEAFTVNLCSNASTGFRWIETAEISTPGVIEQVSHADIFPTESSDPLPPGTPGSQIWTFKVRKGGTNTLSFEYSRDWESGEKAAWTFVLTVDAQ